MWYISDDFPRHICQYRKEIGRGSGNKSNTSKRQMLSFIAHRKNRKKIGNKVMDDIKIS